MSTAPAPVSPQRAMQAPLPERVTGVQLMQGIGVRPAVGFWTDAWRTIVKRHPAVIAMCWIGIVAFFAVFSPLIANGHPIWLKSVGGAGRSYSPLWENLSSVDLVLLVWGLVTVPFVVLGPTIGRGRRVWMMIGALVVAIAVLAISGVFQGRLNSAAQDQGRAAASAAVRGLEPAANASKPFARRDGAGYIVGFGVAAVVFAGMMLVPLGKVRRRVIVVGLAACIGALAVGQRWDRPLEIYNYVQREVSGEIEATYTLVPWSPLQRDSALDRRPPLTKYGPATGVAVDSAPYERRYILGTDAFGQDVLSQLLQSCRLAISIGLVSTGVALVIGVLLGALMGYFGGWVDLLLYRVVEIFMAVPVLFLLIVAVAVLPEELRNTYVIMGIIGMFTWTGMARFTRAEFMKLRNQDFVQAAQATGLPLRSILFRHMLPNGIAPVLVDTSFAIAAAISVEATLSFLGLGPVDSASWGRLLSAAISSEGEFKWWLAVFPGLAIFLTVLSYNLIGEAMRDAIDPKLKKARV